jgi:hypothetical protein
MEVKDAHLVVSLVGRPMLLGDAVGRHHDACAIVTEITVHERFLPLVVAKKFQECGDLLVGRTEETTRGNADMLHSEGFDGALLGSLFGSGAS